MVFPLIKFKESYMSVYINKCEANWVEVGATQAVCSTSPVTEGYKQENSQFEPSQILHFTPKVSKKIVFSVLA